MNEVKRFFPIAKKYFQYLLKLEFKEFFVNVIEFILLAILSMLIIFPLSLVNIVLTSLFTLLSIKSTLFFDIYNLLFKVAAGLVVFYVFIRCFNKRYENISEIRKNREDILYKKKDEEVKEDNNHTQEDNFKREQIMEEFDLPKEIEDKKKKKY